ncbi:capsid protein 2 [Galliform chaphamaparvovirus 16]|nr:capsid protein 2 [Galliform chaphamaparvovirus 16]
MIVAIALNSALNYLYTRGIKNFPDHQTLMSGVIAMYLILATEYFRKTKLPVMKVNGDYPLVFSGTPLIDRKTSWNLDQAKIQSQSQEKCMHVTKTNGSI